MNHFAARARRSGIGWIGEFRCAEHADFRPVQRNEEVTEFGSQVDAQLAADAALRAYMNGHLRRDGEKMQALKLAGNKLFRLGKKPVDIEVLPGKRPLRVVTGRAPA